MSKQADIKVAEFNIPKESLENVVISWIVSRSEQPAKEIVKEVRNYSEELLQERLAEILFQDLPIREYVPIFLVVEGGSRSFWDQFDRARVGWCLPAGSKILMKHGVQKNIEEIEVGDEVLTYNSLTSKKEYEKVRNTFVRDAEEWVVIKISNGNELKLTREHPVAILNKDNPTNIDYVPACELNIDDEVLQHSYQGLNFRLQNLGYRGKTWEERFGDEKAGELKELHRVRFSDPLFQNKMYNRRREWETSSEGYAKKYETALNNLKLAFTADAQDIRASRMRRTYQKPELKEKMSKQAKMQWQGLSDDEYVRLCLKMSIGQKKLLESPEALKARISNFAHKYEKSQLEIELEKLLDDWFPNEWEFVGDGSVSFEGKCPDFIDVNGRKKVIEVYHPYYKIVGYGDIDSYERERKQLFGEYGYDVLFINSDDWNNDGFVIEKVKEFVHNPYISIEKIVWKETIVEKDRAYDIEVGDNHNFFAYGILVHNSFWEQSLRVRDLEGYFDVVMPASFEGNEGLIQEFEEDVEHLKARYGFYANCEGISREDARWIVPIHIVTRGSGQANFRSVLNLIASRTCYFAQASHWGPVTNGIIDGLREYLPALMKREGVLRLPCDGAGFCRFEKDLLDRIEDRSNPLCPIMIDKFCPEHLSRYMLVGEMLKRYPTYIEDSIAYCNRVGRDLDPELFK